MANSYLDQEAAIREVGRGYDIIKQLQGLHQLKSRKGDQTINIHQLAEPLFREALQALNHALCIMNSGAINVEHKAKTVVIESGSPVYNSHGSVTTYDSNQRTENGRGKRRRVGENYWITNTTMPSDDGYQWRKYGDKKITGSIFSRTYFRCTNKQQQGCQAQKQVQQTSNNDPPLFQVTYTNKHTCNSTHQKNKHTCNSTHQMLHLKECNPNSPELLKQRSHLGDHAHVREIFTTDSMVERSCEWDIDSLLMDLPGFSSHEDCLLI